MLGRLDGIDDRRWMLDPGSRANTNAEFARAAYPDAFREYGIDLGAAAPAELAGVVRRSPIAAQLIAALDAWLGVGGPPNLLGLIDELDTDRDRHRLRRTFADNDTAAVAAIVATLDGRKLPPAFAEYIGGSHLTPTRDAARILTAAQAANPSHYGLAIATGFHLHNRQSDRVADRVNYFRIALAIRPQNAVCHHSLSIALHQTGDIVAEEAALRTAIRLEPNFAPPRNNLGLILIDRRDPDAAAAQFREAIRFDPKYVTAHHNLGVALHKKRDLPGAEAAYHEALRLDPNHALAHNGLGGVLKDGGNLAGLWPNSAMQSGSTRSSAMPMATSEVPSTPRATWSGPRWRQRKRPGSNSKA
jgi:Flp pilus assembly protein TadD